MFKGKLVESAVVDAERGSSHGRRITRVLAKRGLWLGLAAVGQGGKAAHGLDDLRFRAMRMAA